MSRDEAKPQVPVWAEGVYRDEYGYYAELEIKGVVQRFRWIEPGEFWMGSPEDEPERISNEKGYRVRLTRGYWLGNTACTQALWKAVMGKNPSRFKGVTRPVEMVSWNDVQGFLKRLNNRGGGLGLCLPTEAEWEYSCRAGTETPFWFGESMHSGQVNFNGNYPYNNTPESEYRGETVPVKFLPPNGWGLYEMHGNVWEWCADYWGSYEDMYRDYIETLSLSKKNSIERYGCCA